MSTLEGHSDRVNLIAWSPDRNRLASASHDKIVRIWDLATSQSVYTLKGHSALVSSISWSLDGSRLASASDDKIIRIWDPAAGQSISTLYINSLSPMFLQFDRVNSNHLHSRTGTFDIGSIASVTPLPHHFSSSPKPYGYGFSHDSSWITYNGVNLLWLPAEFRPQDSSRFAILATNLAIDCSSGHVVFLVLTERSPSNNL